jgi:hypothetical protein
LPISERSRTEPINFELPLTVRWAEGSKQHKIYTVTQEMSSGGVYFMSEGIPQETAVECVARVLLHASVEESHLMNLDSDHCDSQIPGVCNRSLEDGNQVPISSYGSVGSTSFL